MYSSAGLESLERVPIDSSEIEALERRLKELREERGERPTEMPDLTLEKQRLAESNESIFEKAKNAVKSTFDFLIVKPAVWLGKQIKEHPIKTVLIALAAFALWYYSAPLSAGLSGLKEKGLKITSDLLGGAVDIDPTQVDAFDQILNPMGAGPPV